MSILGSSKTLVLEHPDWEISTFLLAAIEPQSVRQNDIQDLFSVISLLV